jgi:hypothetical protein
MTEVRHDLMPRIFFDEPVAIHVLGERQPRAGRALNLSLGGAFVRGDELLPEDTRLVIRFALPDGYIVEAEARVVRHVPAADPLEPCGMALQFLGMTPECGERFERFLGARLEPAAGASVRLHLGDLGFPIRARTHSAWANVLSVDAELPFLRLGSPVSMPMGAPDDLLYGNIRWVSVHVPPDSGIPRINIGIEMGPGEDALEFAEDDPTPLDEEDPVFTTEFADHSFQLDRQLRERRASGAH